MGPPQTHRTSASDALKQGESEAPAILADLRSLRAKILDAWQERAVILTRDEQL